jgi:hypothetical protein
MIQDSDRETIEELQDLVRKYRVCYEVWPEYLMVDGQKTHVGFELELCGACEQGHGHFSPVCESCQRTFEDLRQLASRIVPDGEGAVRCEIQPYDRAIHETPKRQFRPEVILTLKILHQCGFDQPVDRCEELCLKEMRKELADLGVPEGSWFSEKTQGVGDDETIGHSQT